jgi:hypothetical protein
VPKLKQFSTGKIENYLAGPLDSLPVLESGKKKKLCNNLIITWIASWTWSASLISNVGGIVTVGSPASTATSAANEIASGCQDDPGSVIADSSPWSATAFANGTGPQIP